jgi:hypothetical protein
VRERNLPWSAPLPSGGRRRRRGRRREFNLERKAKAVT